MHFPQIISSPADPSAVSFLTTLPPEIRNHVYEYLFKREDQVLLHNADALHEQPHDNHSIHGCSHVTDLLGEYYTRYETEVGTDESFQHDFHEGLALLSSCRQVHHEASGILYGGNNFVFSRVLHRHDNYYRTNHKYKEYFQIAYASQWLTKIGSQIFRLKKVIIDADAMCLGINWWEHSGILEFDLLPLLRIVWRNPEFLDVIPFGNTGRFLKCYEYPESDEGEPYMSTDRATVLNNLLTAFAVNDALGIRKYSFSRRLLSGVSVYLSMHWRGKGYVRTTIERPHSPFYNISISDEGRTVRWELGGCETGEKRNPFAHLPDNVKYRIVELVVYNPDGIMVDLNTHTVVGLDFNITRIRLLHAMSIAKQVARANNITLKMTSNQAVTDFGEFKNLACFLKHTRRYDGRVPPPVQVDYFDWIVCDMYKYNPQTIILEIAPAVVTAFSAIRVNIKDLMVLLSNYHEPHRNYPILHRDSTIRLTLTPPAITRAPPQVTTISATKLRYQIFLFLCDIIQRAEEELPGPLDEITVEDFLEALNPFPDFWMDGHCKLLRASYPGNKAKAPLDFVYGKLSSKELGVLGYSRATSMERIYKKFKKAEEDIAREHILIVWRDLRRACYHDWNWVAAPPGLERFATLS